jgi:hypothetical protein
LKNFFKIIRGGGGGGWGGAPPPPPPPPPPPAAAALCYAFPSSFPAPSPFHEGARLNTPSPPCRACPCPLLLLPDIPPVLLGHGVSWNHPIGDRPLEARTPGAHCTVTEGPFPSLGHRAPRARTPSTTRPKRVWMPHANPGTRARAPLPPLCPLQVLLVYGGGSVCYYI